MGTLKLNKINETKQTKPDENLRRIEAENFSAQTTKTTEKSVEKEKPDKIVLDDEGFVEEFKDFRTVNSTVYRRNDGTCRKIISCTPVRFRDENGGIKAIINSFTDNGEQIVNAENSFKVRFDKKEKSNKIFDLQKGKNVLTLSVSDLQKSCGHESGCKCEICSGKDDTVAVTLGDGTEIQYVSLSDRIKENILIKEKRDVYEYRFSLDIGNLNVEESENRLLLKDAATDETEFVIPAPFMYDADKKYSDKVSYEIDVNGTELLIKVVADAEFINSAERKFPVTIDPQIIVEKSSSNMICSTDLIYASGTVSKLSDALLVGKDISNNLFRAHITVLSTPTVQKGIILRKYLRLVSLGQKEGYFYVNGKKYSADKPYYEIDYTGESFEFMYDENAEAGQCLQFNMIGDDGPKIILEYMSYDSDNNLLHEYGFKPCVKEIDCSDKVKSFLYLKDGEFATTFKSFDSADFVLPLDIVHVHKTGFGENGLGLNWRLNLNKKLEVAADDKKENTRFVYTDEFGDKYVFSEKYYYVKDGVKKFVDKYRVLIKPNGELMHGNYKIYKIQFCNGYTLLPQINDFYDYKYIEQRQQERIQLEDYVTQMKAIINSYVRVNSKDGIIKMEFYDTDKGNFEALFKEVAIYSDDIVITKSEALQLQALYADLKLLTDNSEKDEERKLKQAQIDHIIKQTQDNLEYIKSAFIKYFNKKDELELLLKQTPVNYIKDENGLISGFNSNGELVLLCDKYGNYVNIVYDSCNRISEIYDSKNTVMRFEYENDLLHSITDCIGATVKYDYDGKKLISATFADGSVLSFKYSNEKIGNVESSDGIQWKTSFENGKFLRLLTKRLQPVSGTVSDLKADYWLNGTTLTYKDGSTEYYHFDNCSRLSRYENNDVAKFGETIDYTYEYDCGKKITAVTSSDREYIHTTEITQYNELDLLVSKINDWQPVSDTVKVKTETVYAYDLNNVLIKEVATKFTDKSGKISSVKRITNYSYNAQGSLVLTETYVEGEELTSGKNYKQQVYDDNGNVIKTVSWNSLDSSSKFYSESVIAENGQVTAEKDETGEVSAEYEYLSGTNVINSVKNANGGKIAYGRNPYNRTVTSVTKSTENGEANCNDIVYVHGLPQEVKSGNTSITYEYDHKGRKNLVCVNGKLQYEYSYQDAERIGEDDAFYGKKSETVYAGEGQSYKFVYQGNGAIDNDINLMDKHETYTVGSTVLWSKDYGFDGNLTNFTYKENGVDKTVKYLYDKFDRLTQAQTSSVSATATTPVLTENFTYNEYGELAQKTYGDAVTHTYSYTYKNNAARGLDYIVFGTYKFKPLSDVNGRNTGREIYDGEEKVAGEYISYRKVGDHATNMPSAVWYASGNNIKDSVKYTYDKCGNITEIRVNGHITAKYSYDSLNRLVREDNKVFNKTVLYKYDNCGNITERCEYAYTSKTGEELEELACKHYEYRYNGDVLVNYNGEEFAYNNLGSPTKYRNKTLQWQYGKYLTDFDGITFAYNGIGRRVKKNETEFTYDNDGKLIKQSNGLEFVYDNAGVVGVIYNGEQYFYRKDVQGNITAVLDKNGAVVVNYIYDAWGNHAIVDSNGADVTSGIGLLNPFRYRGYYYDTETGLYYLQTRYYDPELGRFISQDSVDYADPEKINGLNLYAYCGNNPVMGYDPTGTTEWWEWLFGLIIAAVLVVGAVIATAMSFGAATPTIGLAWGLAGSILGGMAFNATMSLNTQYQTGNLDWGTFGTDIAVGFVSGIIAYGTGQIFSAFGYGFGMYLNQMAINGIVVSKVFTNFVLPKTFEYVGYVIGGVVGGSFVDKYANILAGKQDNLVQRILNNYQSVFWGKFLEFLLKL